MLVDTVFASVVGFGATVTPSRDAVANGGVALAVVIGVALAVVIGVALAVVTGVALPLYGDFFSYSALSLSISNHRS